MAKVYAMWKPGFGLFHADAQKVADEIMEIVNDVSEATPRQILDKAKDKNTELHNCFEWNDSIAAEKYRIQQAGDIVRHLVIRREEVEEELNGIEAIDKPQIRVFHRTETTGGYKPIQIIVKNEDEYQKLLQMAYAELHAFKMKYKHLQELDYILSLID